MGKRSTSQACVCVYTHVSIDTHTHTRTNTDTRLYTHNMYNNNYILYSYKSILG